MLRVEGRIRRVLVESADWADAFGPLVNRVPRSQAMPVLEGAAARL